MKKILLDFMIFFCIELWKQAYSEHNRWTNKNENDGRDEGYFFGIFSCFHVALT